MTGRRIDIDIVGHDNASSVFNRVSSNMAMMSSRSVSALSTLNGGLRRYNMGMNGIYRSTQIALVGAGYLVYKFTKDSINAFADFERQHAKTMGAIASNYDKTTLAQKKFMDDQQKLKSQSLSLGTWGPEGKGSLYGPAEVATTQTSLTKAGFNAQQTSEVVQPIMKFAGGNDLTLDNATEYAVNISEIFGLKKDPKSYTKMLDEITKTADMSTIDTSDIFNSLKFTGPIANALDKSLEDVLGVLSVMGNSGLKGSMAGTGFQAFLTRILDPSQVNETSLSKAPTENVANKMTSYLASVTDKKGNFKDMPTVTANLDDAMDGLSDKEQAWFARKLFGLHQMKAAYVLGANGGDVLKDSIDKITNESDGTNQLKYDIMMKSAYGSQTRLTNAWAGTKIDVGYRLAPFTTAIMDELFNTLNKRGNYKMDFSKIKNGLNEASKMIGEQYGKAMEEFVSGTGNVIVDGSRIAKVIAPTLTGFGEGYAKLLTGDIPGALKSFKEGIDKSKDSIGKLPPELQTMAEQVEKVTTVLAILAGVNFVARIAENITNIGLLIATLKKTSMVGVGGAGSALKTMSVYGQVVNVYGAVNSKGGVGGTGGAVVPGSTGTKAPKVVPVANYKDGTPKIPGQYKDGTKIIPGVNKDGSPKKGATPITEDTSTSSTKSPKAPLGPKLAGIFNKASWVYMLGEMFGVNDMLLDKTPAKNGTDARKNIDKGRSIVNWGFTASFIDSLLLKGAVKKALFGGLLKGAPGFGTSIMAIATEAIGSVGLGTLALGTLPLAGGGLAILSEAQKNKTAKEDQAKVSQALKDSKKPLFNRDGSLIKDDKGALVMMPTSAEAKATLEKNKFKYNNGKSSTYITSAPPRNDSGGSGITAGLQTELNKPAMEAYRLALADISYKDNANKSQFSTAQKIFKTNTGKDLDYNAFMNTKPQWDKIIPSNLFGPMSTFSGSLKPFSEVLVSTQPAFKALAGIAVDKNGNVDALALQKALVKIGLDSGKLSEALLKIANIPEGPLVPFPDMKTINKPKVIAPSTGSILMDAMEIGKNNGKGTVGNPGFDLTAYVQALNPLSTIRTNGSTILEKLNPLNGSIVALGPKLDIINGTINTMPPPVVNVSAPHVSVSIDKFGNVTQQVTKPTTSYLQDTSLGEKLFNMTKPRFGG